MRTFRQSLLEENRNVALRCSHENRQKVQESKKRGSRNKPPGWQLQTFAPLTPTDLLIVGQVSGVQVFRCDWRKRADDGGESLNPRTSAFCPQRLNCLITAFRVC